MTLRAEPVNFLLRGLQILAVVVAIVLVSFHMGVFFERDRHVDPEPVPTLCPPALPETTTYDIYYCNITWNQDIDPETSLNCWFRDNFTYPLKPTSS